MLTRKDLHSYQNTAVAHIIKMLNCGLFLDMGLGKTVSTLTAVNDLIFDYLEISKVLIVAPKRVVESVWTAEVEKWEHLKHLKTSRIIGNPMQRRAALVKKADIYLISRDNLAWLIGQYGGNMLPFDMLVVDESSSFKNHKSVRFKALRGVLSSFQRVVILTGTPAPNGLLDLWAQIYLLDQGERLGKFITSYRREYFREGQRNGHIVYNYNVQSDGEKRIHDKIKDVCISMKAKDYLDLPDRIDNFIKIKFPEKLQKQYADFERQQVLEFIEGQEDLDNISVVNAAALSNKLLQFANGAVYDEDKNWHAVHDLKLDALEEIIETAGGKPVLVAWTYRHDLYRMQERLKKYKIRELKTDKDIQDWNARKIQVLMMHPASGGHGLNLQAGGSIIVWFGQTWALELYQQLNARLHRQGQKLITVIHHLVAHKTIEQKVVRVIKGKANKQEGLMAAIKSKIQQYVKDNKK